MESATTSLDGLPGLPHIQQRIAVACERAGRPTSDVQLIAVTKTQDPAILKPLHAAGIVDYGENRTQHLAAMHAEAPSSACFHYIGRVQSRQFSDVVAHADVLHSLADRSHIAKLARACEHRTRPLTVYIQVAASDETQKAGVAPEHVPDLVEAISQYSQLTVAGLMTMAPSLTTSGVTAATVQRCFALTRDLATRCGLNGLSMGMSQDFELAIAEGATAIRVGSALYSAPR